jgi:hypothetical protein
MSTIDQDPKQTPDNIDNIETLPAAPNDASDLAPITTKTPESHSPFDVIRNFLHKKVGKVTAAAAGILLVGGGTTIAIAANAPHETHAAVGNSAEPFPSSSPDITVPATPEAPPSTAPETTSGSLTESEKTLLTTYESMATSKFSDLSKQEQGIYAYLTLKKGLPDFIVAWHATSKDLNDIAPPASTVSNNANEISKITGWEKRYIWALSGEDRAKYMLAIFHDGEASPQYKKFKQLSDSETTPTVPGVLAYNKSLPWPQSETSITGIVTDSNGDKYENTSFVEFDGTNGASTQYLESLSIDGAQVQMWINK